MLHPDGDVAHKGAFGKTSQNVRQGEEGDHEVMASHLFQKRFLE
jgi:hypothetical protein